MRVSLPRSLLLSVALAMAGPSLHPCTTAVVSGSATPDGRPLLWKNRDTSSRENEVIYSDKAGAHAFVGVINKGAGTSSAIWMGANAAGFCIENSVSSDLAVSGTSGPGNGTFMRQALEQCASVAEFEQFLQSTNGKRTTSANFGVIDRFGGAAIFETSPVAYTKFDANDPVVAPHGIVVRSNFAFTGQPAATVSSDAGISSIYSGGRFLRARNLFADRVAAGLPVTHEFILQHLARDLADGNQNPVPGSINAVEGTLPELINAASTIGRATTVSAAVFRGVLPHEDPRLTTMWTLLGQPNFTVAVPVWPVAGNTSTLLRGPQGSVLGALTISLRNRNFSAGSLLRGMHLPDIWGHNLPWEQQTFATVEAALATWRSGAINTATMTSLHASVTAAAYDHLVALEQAIQWPTPDDAPPLFHLWEFNDPAGTQMNATANAISPETVWSGTLPSSTTTGDGVFRVRRMGDGLNRRADVGDTGGAETLYLVAEIAGWRLTGTTASTSTEPLIQFQFMNGLAETFPSTITAGVTLLREVDGRVTLRADAGGTGGQSSAAMHRFSEVLDEKLTLVTAFNIAAEEYTVSYRLGDGEWQEFFTGATSPGRGAVSQRIYFRGDFNGGGERYLDLDRLYISSVAPDQVVFPGPSPYDLWVEGFANLSSAQRSPLAAPAGDGVPNILKFVLGLDPLKTSCGGLPMPTMEATPEGDFIVLQVPLNPAALAIPGLAILVECGSGMGVGQWQVVDSAEVSIGPGAVATVRVPVAGQQGMFLRLRVDGIDALLPQ